MSHRFCPHLRTFFRSLTPPPPNAHTTPQAVVNHIIAINSAGNQAQRETGLRFSDPHTPALICPITLA